MGLRHKSLASLGRYCFQACLWQWPMHAAFTWMGHFTGLYSMPMHVGRKTAVNGPAFAAFALSLWFCAGVFAEQVEAPLAHRLRTLAENIPHVDGLGVPQAH